MSSGWGIMGRALPTSDPVDEVLLVGGHGQKVEHGVQRGHVPHHLSRLPQLVQTNLTCGKQQHSDQGRQQTAACPDPPHLAKTTTTSRLAETTLPGGNNNNNIEVRGDSDPLHLAKTTVRLRRQQQTGGVM